MKKAPSKGLNFATLHWLWWCLNVNAIFVWEINAGLILQIQPTISSVLAKNTTLVSSPKTVSYRYFEPNTLSVIALGFFLLFCFLFILFPSRRCLKRRYLNNFCIRFAQMSFITIIIAEKTLLFEMLWPKKYFLWNQNIYLCNILNLIESCLRSGL